MLDNFNIIFYLFMYLKSVIKGVTKGWMIRESSCFPFELVRKREKKKHSNCKKKVQPSGGLWKGSYVYA